ncbi:anther-specific proline-rich protein APG [Monomorium pharaonis]|uniref:anther-specific proline-rich protein APG n=1 Tax=Monomorium pharaonis TaxID=307658 RepID=UPI00063F99A3|nr:anther-specific proline-rich protein APG [Monomorium pharaonis]XP_012528703.1 anther-specific proline-rich protein APG [Monomorium pharaonis]
MYPQLVVLCVTVASVIGDLPPGTRRNTYLPPEPTKGGYTYSKPTVPFTKPTPTAPFPQTRPTPSFPGPRPTPSFPGPRPTPSFPGTRPTPSFPGPRPTPTFPGPTRPTPFPSTGTGYPTGPRPTPPFPDFISQQSGGDKNVIGGPGHDHHHHEPGMPFDFNYAVKDDAFGNDYSHNAISDGEVVRGEYKIQLPDGRTQLVRYTADWQHGFSAQVTYDGNPRFDGNFNRGY